MRGGQVILSGLVCWQGVSSVSIHVAPVDVTILVRLVVADGCVRDSGCGSPFALDNNIQNPLEFLRQGL